MSWTEFDLACMDRALALASLGEGQVEPNPMVGCVLARDGNILGEGYHARFGGPHAEVVALAACETSRLRGATAYVTLEPCCHTGKTPPCTNALLAAGIERVVAAQRDPFPRVAGGGFAALQAAGIQIAVGCREAAARALNAPYLKLQEQGEPWVIAKWAMSLDGKIATRTGQSQWISSPESRAVVHALRGRVDAIIVGCGTALADDPLLTARPAGPRPAIRIVLDAHAQLPLTSRLVQTAREVPCLVVAGPQAAVERTEALRAAGCEVWLSTQEDRTAQTTELLRALGRRGCTNVLVEGGSIVLGSWFDAQQIDEVHAFIAPKLIGGREAFSPLAGHGLAMVAGDMQLVPLPLQDSLWGMVGNDMYFRGRIKRDREGESA